MADIKVQQAPEQNLGGAESDNLAARLDELLEQYLHKLDAYQKAQQQLTSLLSSGYMSLAQANFTNNAHTRYGRDYYDERMQASRKVLVHEDDNRVKFSISRSAEQNASPEAGPESSTAENKNEDSATSKSDADPEKTEKSVPRDPLRWFGILVPPALRAAQSSFVSAVEGPVIELSNISRELRQQEIEIGRVRKQIKKL